MLGHLYRYPHPHDPARFIYVGQGIKRDPDHRAKRTSFGSRFKEAFPGVDLPRPIREHVDVQSQLELNELETVWMFQYHTWYGYLDGMNLTLPGSQDYGNMGRLSALAASARGLYNVKPTKEGCFKGGKRAGSLAVKNGHLSRAGSIGGKLGGHRQGLKNAESGHLNYIRHIRWHIVREQPSSRCSFCCEQSLIIAFA